MYLGQKDEKVHQFVLIKIKASIIIIRDKSKSTYLPFEVNLLFSQYETDTGMQESFINFPILSNSS